MKKYLTARIRLAALFAVVALGSTTLIAPKVLEAQSTPEKIRLMAETLRARDSGDLLLAKNKAEELIKIAPNDSNVQRLLASINAELDRRNEGGSVYGQAAETSVETVMATEAAPMMSDAKEPDAAASAFVTEVADEQSAKISAAEQAMDDAEKLAELGAYADALNMLNAASASLTLNTATADTIEELEEAKAGIILIEVEALAEAGDYAGAEARLADYRAAGGSSRTARKLAAELSDEIGDPYQYDIDQVSPKFVAQNKIVRDLIARARKQFLEGDYDGASATFKEIEARDPNNAEAKLYATRIAEIISKIHQQNLYKTRAQMLSEVDQSWERPKIFDITDTIDPSEIDPPLQDKLESIVIPQVNFAGMELSRVLSTLSELSYEYATDGVGVNIIPLYNTSQADPIVNIALRNLNLDRILQFVTQQANYAYDVTEDAVTVTPDGGADSVSTATEFFPISRATVIRLTGFRDGGGSSSGPVDPFAAPTSSSSSSPSADEETEALQAFFSRAGVNFDLQGSSLAFDGEQLIVTQTRRNLERMRTILRNYNEVKQVEIESKFLEVSQGNLDELGFDWAINKNGTTVASFNPNSLSDTFVVDSAGSTINIDSPQINENTVLTTSNTTVIEDSFGNPIVNADGDVQTITNSSQTIQENELFPAQQISRVLAPPSLPNALDFGSDVVGSIFSKNGLISQNGYSMDFAIRAISRQSGSDLMSAPKVTVLSGKRANIRVAQEFRYPESYGDIESTVSSSNTGGAAISITAGTPQDFVMRNVGVELSVTPNVENDDTISLILEPRVTEFEGFVEYGGPSVALAGGVTASVPAGFYQPVFSVREVSTEVTVYDGATVVMGGLTRDEVKTVKDKVPFLGDIPGIGRLFRSEGETRQKRNLLIFVTANLVSPGGSPARQNYRSVNANSLFQNPTIMTPSGTVNRSIDEAAE